MTATTTAQGGPLLGRRMFLKLSGWGVGVGVLARSRPAHAGPRKTKTLSDSGRAVDWFTVERPPPPPGAGLYHDSYGSY